MKNIFGRKGLLGLATLAVIALAGCGPQSSTTAVSSLPPQVTELGCPVQSSGEMQAIFRGAFGVDGLSRPLNAHGVPVDTDGNCLSTAPVPEVYSAPVSAAYISVLSARYHYTYYYDPLYVHVYHSPTVIYHVGSRPSGHVIVQTVAPASAHVTVPAGNTHTVRPGASAPAAVPTSVTPPRASGTGSIFNRPAAAPAAAPSAVTPPRAAAPTSTFNRPAAPAYHAPSFVTPPRASAPTRTFSRGRH